MYNEVSVGDNPFERGILRAMKEAQADSQVLEGQESQEDADEKKDKTTTREPLSEEDKRRARALSLLEQSRLPAEVKTPFFMEKLLEAAGDEQVVLGMIEERRRLVENATKGFRVPDSEPLSDAQSEQAARQLAAAVT